MKFNTKTRYGLRTILELSLNENNSEGILQKEISKNQDVSVRYLDHIIASLKAAGLIVNVGGKKSGYRLARPAGEISIYDIYLAFEGEMAIIDCLVADKECPQQKSCVLRGYWCDLNNTIKSSMKSMNMETLAANFRISGDLAKEA